MSTTIESQQQCPECGQFNSKEKAVCFGCGCILAEAKPYRSLGRNPPPPQPTDQVPVNELFKLGRPLYLALLLVVVIVLWRLLE